VLDCAAVSTVAPGHVVIARAAISIGTLCHAARGLPVIVHVSLGNAESITPIRFVSNGRYASVTSPSIVALM
jgi:hypothetical protein